ncbi:Histone-lysine N-methyltransferase ezh2 [Globodera pallida]|nr:Histone-lysine N-methyltransferase ezh2 [Globodera pallida]
MKQQRHSSASSSSDQCSQSVLGHLMQAYWEVRAFYEKKKIGNEGLKAFKKARIEALKPPLAVQPLEITPLVLRELKPIKDRPMAVLKRADANGTVSSKCPIIPLEHLEATPSMQYWTHTEVNINAEDEFTLSHIPFLGDAEDDTSFCADLMKTFPDGIHGTVNGCGEYINDYILYYTVKRVEERFPNSLKTIFKVVHEQFPNKASVHELFSLYPDLQRRFLPESIVKQKFTNDRGELVFNFSNERLLNSYELLLCHKCFSYDCIMHNAVTNNGYGDSKKMVRSKRQSSGGFGRHDGWSSYGQKLKKRPCSDKCYINIAVQTVSNSGSGKKGNKLKSSIVSSRQQQLIIDIAGGVLPAKWTPHEEAIFNVLRSTGEEEYCRITIVLNLSLSATRKKTCQEVHEYACRAGPQSPRLEMPSSPVKNAKCRKNNGHRQFRAIKWANTNGTVENHGRFIPCKAKCDCLLNTCQCVKVNNLCTKYCGCVDCKNRFPGCRCAPGNCRTKQCQCYFASWECDPDVCKSCNCDKLDGSGEPICKNVSIQRGLQKRLIVAPSQVAGWGCFANEDIEKNDFVSEYCGEVISTEESERRGKIYDRIKCSYLFGLNDEQVVDATRVGNVIRFANHSQNPNCRAKVIVVNGDHKIGIFAQRHIKCGEELFFDYGTDSFWKQQIDFVPKELAQMLRHKERLGGFGGGGPGIARGGSV